MRVDDNVGRQTFACEWHVLVSILNTTCSLLSMPRGKFITNLRDTHRSHTNLAELVALAVQRQHHLIDNTRFGITQKRRCVTFGIVFDLALQLRCGHKYEFCSVLIHLMTIEKKNETNCSTLTSSSLSARVMVLPMITSSPDTRRPGAMIPSSSNLS